MTESLTLVVLNSPPTRASELADALLDAGAGAVEQKPVTADEAVLWAYGGQSSPSELASFARQWAAQRGFPLEVSEQPLDSNWAHAWTQDLKPFVVRGGLTVVPVVRGRPPPVAPGAERELLLEAGFAFGYGEHPTTQMISAWISEGAAQMRVLDLGTGSGILALIALASGAESVLGLDIDEEALVLARRNAVLNELSEASEFGSTKLSTLTSDFDVVVANVDALTLQQSAADLCRLLVRGGRIALTGLLTEQCEPVVEAFREGGVLLTCSESRNDWALLTGERSPSPTASVSA